MQTNRHLDRLAFRFFQLFAQYEATMKERDYFNARSGRIEPDWNRFANEVVGARFKQEPGTISESVNYILQHPPMRQAVNDDRKIIWQEVSNDDQSVQALFGHICRMRNNLFHGAKFNGTWFNPKRSETLLNHGLVILEHYKGWLDVRNVE
jgi:hypothetical protein